jgi:phage tail sheath protein FI
MAEKIVSPGVFTREVDQSFLPAGIAAIGAALIGPTVKGPAGVPTVVTSYSEYQQIFGDSFSSGSGAVQKQYQYLTSHAAKNYLKSGNALTVVRILVNSASYAVSPATSNVAATGSGAAFKLYTLSDGALLNSGNTSGSTNGSGSASDETTNGALVSGSVDNLRWEVSSVNSTKGTFNLSIRRGDDTGKRKTYLEQWNNLSLDPNSTQYIANVIGDQVYTVRDAGTTAPYLQLSGSYPNSSKYVRVEVLKTTYNYLNSNGTIAINAYSASLPAAVSGTFANGSDGFIAHPQAFNETISSTNSQGFNISGPAASAYNAYNDAINLLSNQDEYDINLLLLPGVVNNGHSALVTQAIQMCENRGDCFVIVDPTMYGDSLTTVITQTNSYDSNYAAMYYPWLQTRDNTSGQNVWVPPSTMMGGVYSFNDLVGAEWFAPAGLNRGGLDLAIQAERKLTRSNRDDLYEGSINPLATFPNTGVAAWGQKTLQKKASALDRINVRRLLINAKKFVASATKYLVFEQNTTVTRNRFLGIVNPYFENVQQRQGLYAFRVVMDESNNTADVIDRNQMVGAIYLQPSKTAEYIIVDFNILPTGANFPE